MKCAEQERGEGNKGIFLKKKINEKGAESKKQDVKNSFH